HTKCASFVTLVLQQAYQWDDADFTDWFRSSSPYAADYHDAILAGNGFLEIQHITDIQSGDIIAIKYPYTPDPDDDTGHVMTAAGSPTLSVAAAPVVAGTKQYAIEVIDSTKTPHDSTDTRKAAGDTGAGLGVFRLYANAAGTIVGYTWSPEHTKEKDYHD